MNRTDREIIFSFYLTVLPHFEWLLAASYGLVYLLQELIITTAMNRMAATAVRVCFIV